MTLEVAADWRFTTGRNDSNYSQACPLNDREAAATITFGTCDETPTSCLWSEDPDGGGWDCGGCVCPNDGVGGLDWRGGDDAAVRVDDGEEGGSLLCGDFSALNAALTTR